MDSFSIREIIMAKEFFWPCRIHWTMPGKGVGVSGGIIYPIHLGYHTLRRRNIDKNYPHLTRRLLDPQLYLVGLDPYKCRKKCGYFASYPWFPTKDISEYDSSQHKQRDWQNELTKNVHNLWLGQLPKKYNEIENTIDNCLKEQESLNCESFILPSLLTVDQSTDYRTEIQWLDAGLKRSKRINDKRQNMATIAISDSCLRLIKPWENELIDLIVDQVSSRELDGAYIVLEQSHEQDYYCTHHNTVGCLLRLAYGLKASGLKRIVVAYAGTAGFLALLAGADIWSSGWYLAERKLKLTNIEDSEGRAYPAYYSHNFASEIYAKNDIDSIYKNGLLPEIQELTDASKPLHKALKSGYKVDNVAEWRYKISNVTAAREHFLSSAINRTAEVANLGKDELLVYGLKWLEGARDLADIISKYDNRHKRTAVNHQSAWLRAFSEFVEQIS
jgi:hypothetical protein